MDGTAHFVDVLPAGALSADPCDLDLIDVEFEIGANGEHVDLRGHDSRGGLRLLMDIIE